MKELQPDLREKLQVMTLEDLIEQALQLAEQNDALQASGQDASRKVIELRSQLTTAEKTTRQVTEENNFFREQLHSMEVDNARLRGYQQRVQEFDPVTDRQQYADQTRPLVVHAGADTYGESPLRTPMDGRLGEPWYRRRG